MSTKEKDARSKEENHKLLNGNGGDPADWVNSSEKRLNLQSPDCMYCALTGIDISSWSLFRGWEHKSMARFWKMAMLSLLIMQWTVRRLWKAATEANLKTSSAWWWWKPWRHAVDIAAWSALILKMGKHDSYCSEDGIRLKLLCFWPSCSTMHGLRPWHVHWKFQQILCPFLNPVKASWFFTSAGTVLTWVKILCSGLYGGYQYHISYSETRANDRCNKRLAKRENAHRCNSQNFNF